MAITNNSNHHDVKGTLCAGESRDAENRLWESAKLVYADVKTDTWKLGKIFVALRSLYSQRSFGDSRRNSGRGTFEKQIIDRGYDPRRVREYVADYEATQQGKPTTAAKRKDRRAAKKTIAKSMKLAPASVPTMPQPNAPELVAQDQGEASDTAQKRFFDVHLEGLSEDCDAMESANIPAVARAYKEREELSSALDSIANVIQRLSNLSFSLTTATESMVTAIPSVNAVAELAAAA